MFRCVFRASVSLVSCSKYVLLFFFVWVGVCWLLRCSCSCFSVCCLFCVVFAVVSALRAFGLEVLRLSSHAASCRLCVAHGTRNLAANPSHSTVSGQGGGTPRDLFTPGGRATSALPSRGAFLVARLPRSPAKKTCATTLFSRPCLTLAHHASNTTGTPSYSEKHTDFDAPPFADVHKSDFFLMRLLWFSYRPKPPKTIHFHTRKLFHKDIGQEHPTHPPARHACNLRTFTRVRKTMVFCMQNAPFPIPR